jgi:predicted amidohydrolase
MRRARIAAMQMNIRHLAKAENIARHIEMIDRAKDDGCALLLFPELSATGHNGSPDILREAEPADGPAFQAIATHAAKRDIHVSYGFAELYRGTHYNTQAIVGPNGLVGLQRKVHASHDEFFLFRQAYVWAIYDLGFAKIGTAICHDSDFFETWRVLALMGAQVVLLPHAVRKMNGPDGGLTFDGEGAEMREEAYLTAQSQLLSVPNAKYHDVQARTNGVYAVFSDHVGFDGRSSHVGGAYILGPDGLMKAASIPSLHDQLVIAELDPELFARVRLNPWFTLRKRRPEVYAELTRQV